MSSYTEENQKAKFFIGAEDEVPSEPNVDFQESTPQQANKNEFDLSNHSSSYSDEDYMAMEDRKQIVVGICAMDKKVSSKPMREILNRLAMFEYLTLEVFPQDVILNQQLDDWPLCDCLISFHSAAPEHLRFLSRLAEHQAEHQEMAMDYSSKRSFICVTVAWSSYNRLR